MVVVKVDAFSRGTMRRGLTMIGGVNLVVRKTSLEESKWSDAEEVQGSLTLLCPHMRLPVS